MPGSSWRLGSYLGERRTCGDLYRRSPCFDSRVRPGSSVQSKRFLTARSAVQLGPGAHSEVAHRQSTSGPLAVRWRKMVQFHPSELSALSSGW